MYEVLITSSKRVKHDRLLDELAALAIPNVRGYSIFGVDDMCDGVYVWDDSAPVGEYAPLELSEENASLVRSTIDAHVYPSLNEVRLAKVASLMRDRDNAILAGLVSSVTGVEYEYPFDERAQLNMNGQLTMLVADPTIESVDWATESGQIVSHTRTQFIDLCKDAVAHKRAMFIRYWTMLAQISAATTVEEIDAVVW